MKLTKKQAKELSIKKWEYIVNNNGIPAGLLDKYPELNELICYCGYCEKYELENHECGNCPLFIKVDGINHNCYADIHPWHKWYNNPTKTNAQKVLDLIKQS